MKITAEQIQSGRTLSEVLDVAEARRICLSEEWILPFYLPQISPTIRTISIRKHIARRPSATTLASTTCYGG